MVFVKYNGTEYYYLRNAQGDVVKLIDASGVSVVEYTYDTWGKAVTTTGTLAGTLGLFQPFRYRGYVYDWETGFYYLQSRYYDPTVGRFISADILLSTGQGVLGHNCYAYCLGNPVRYKDTQGTEAEENSEDNLEDVTDDLNALMEEHANELLEYQKELFKSAFCSGNPTNASAIAYFATMSYFINKVKDNGEWDLKNQTQEYSKTKKVIYNGKTYTGEQIGNIHFGYVGRAIYSSWFLHFGAGVNQLMKGCKKENLSYFFDEPEDYSMIEYGIMLYEEKHLQGEYIMKRFLIICFAVIMLILFGGCEKENKLSNRKYNTIVKEIQTHNELIQKCIESMSALADDNPVHIYINASIIRKEYSDAAEKDLQNTDETIIELFKEIKGLNGINVLPDRIEFAGWGGLYSTIGFCYCPDHALTIEDLMGVNSAGEIALIDDNVYYWQEKDGDNYAFIKNIDQDYYYYEIWF